MNVVREVGEVSYTHIYMLSLKTITWATILVIVVMAGLYALLGLPPGLDSYYGILYFHSIGIAIAALATYLVISIFDLQKHEPPIDFSDVLQGLRRGSLRRCGRYLLLESDFGYGCTRYSLGFVHCCVHLDR